MELFLKITIIILLAAIVAVLFAGLITMAIGGRFGPEFRNKLMKTRVVLQGIILLIAVCVFTISLF